MATLAERLQTKAAALVKKYGTAATVTVDSGTFDPTTSTRTVIAASHSVFISPPEDPRRFLSAGASTHEGTERRYLATQSTFSPAPGQKVKIGTTNYRIVATEPFSVTGSVVVYSVDLVRG